MQALSAAATLLLLLSPFSALPFSKQSPGSTVSGVIVVDALEPQVPITEATITLYSKSRVLQTKSDARGRFEFTELAEGDYQLEVVQAGFVSKITDLSVSARKPESQVRQVIGLRLAATDTDCGDFDSTSYERNKAINGQRLAGVVLEERYSRKPLTRTAVRLFNIDGTELSAQQTNEQGEFLFTNIEPGRYLLKASHDGYFDLKTRVFWVTRENQTRITLVPLKTGMIFVCA
jgi:serine-aspartate repeat-containing protein C/D/E